MEDKVILDNTVIADTHNSINSETDNNDVPKIRKKQNKIYKEKLCKVIYYNRAAQTLDIYFDCYGIRLNGIANFEGNTVSVYYKSEIGKPDFEINLKD